LIIDMGKLMLTYIVTWQSEYWKLAHLVPYTREEVSFFVDSIGDQCRLLFLLTTKNMNWDSDYRH